MKEDRIGIPDFMEKTSDNYYKRPRQNLDIEVDDDYRLAKENSLNPKIVQVKRSRKKLSIGKCVTAGIAFVTIASGVNMGVSYIQDERNLHNYLEPLNQVLVDNSGRTQGNDGYWINDVAVANTYREMIDQGEYDELAVAYFVTQRLTDTYEQDEADTIFDIALGEDRNEWAQKRGYSGIDDPAFLSESRTMLLRNMNSKDSQDELGAMLSDSVVAIDTQVKGMGGR